MKTQILVSHSPNGLLYSSGSPAASWLLGRGARGCLARWAVKGRSRGAGGGRVATGGDFQPSPRPPTREGVTSTHKASCTRPQSGGSPGALDPAPGMEPGARLGDAPAWRSGPARVGSLAPPGGQSGSCSSTSLRLEGPGGRLEGERRWLKLGSSRRRAKPRVE